MTCGECGNVTAPGAGFPNHVYCKRFLLHMKKREDASKCRYFIPKHLTNADRIRSMTDEELATFLTNNQVEVFGRVVKEMCNLLLVSFPYEELTKEVTDKYEEMKKEQLDWLRQEVADERP